MPSFDKRWQALRHNPIVITAFVLAFVATGVVMNLNIRAADTTALGTPVNVRAFTGGNDIALLWNAPAGVTPKSYTVLRDGVAVATVDAVMPTIAHQTTTARYYDKNIVAGQTYRYQVRVTSTANTTSALTESFAVTQPTEAPPVPVVTVDSSSAPDLDGYLQKGKALIETWYPKFAAKIAYPDYTPHAAITLRTQKGAVGAANVVGNVITINEDYARSVANTLSGPNVVLHELVHVIQAYKGDYTLGVIEGIADWTRNTYFNEFDSSVPKGFLYTDGYDKMAYLLSWVQARYNAPNLVRALNVAAHNGVYSDDIFKQYTGKSLGQLWTEMSGQRVTSPSPVVGPGGFCMDVTGYGAANGTPIQVWTCNTEVYYNQRWLYVANAKNLNSGTVRASGACLTIAGGGTANGVKLQAWQCNGSWNQEWVHRTDGSLLNPATGKCAQPSGLVARGALVELSACTGALLQRWSTPAWGDIAGHTMSATGPVTGLAGKCVDLAGSSTANGTLLQLSACTGVWNQDWTFYTAPDSSTVGTVRIAGKCADIYAALTGNGTKIELWECNGGRHQEWMLRPDGSLFNPGSAKCIQVKGGATANGTKLELWDCNGSAAQKWASPAWADTTGHKGTAMAAVMNLGNTQCLDLSAYSIANGAKVQPWACLGDWNQNWRFNKKLSRGDGELRIGGKCLDVAGADKANGAKVALWQCTGGANQLWQPRADGTLYNVYSAKCLRPKGGSAAAGVALEIWTCSTAANNKWHLPGV